MRTLARILVITLAVLVVAAATAWLVASWLARRDAEENLARQAAEIAAHREAQRAAAPAELADPPPVSSTETAAAAPEDDGEVLWKVNHPMPEVIPTPVVGHGLVFASFSKAGPTFAIRPGGSGDVTSTHVAWQAAKGAPFVPSPLVYGDELYMIND